MSKAFRTWEEMMEDIKRENPEAREFLERAEDIANYLIENDCVEVVRCINCKHYREKSQSCRVWSKYGTVMVIPSGFCYRGELNE